MILILLIVLFLLMVLVGGNRGMDSFFALVRTAIAMVVNIYLISWGLPAIPVTLLVSAFFVATVLYAQNGINAKMHAAAFSVMIVVVIVMLSAGPLLYRAGISGYNEIEQYEEISMYLSGNLQLSMAAVSVSAVVLGLLGAVMDTAVAITTAVNEVYANNRQLLRKELAQSGLRVGKDILGTTVNTLFFAGLGESIMLAILFMKNAESVASILNSKSLLQEVTGLLIGGIGCLAIIPISSLMAAWFLTDKNILKKFTEKNKKSVDSDVA